MAYKITLTVNDEETGKELLERRWVVDGDFTAKLIQENPDITAALEDAIAYQKEVTLF